MAICLRSPCPHFGEPPYSTQTSHSLGLYGLEGASKINQGTKSNTHQPFKLHLFKAERLVSLLPYQNLNESWRNHAKKLDINQFSGDFRFTHPQEHASHNSPRRGPPWPLSNAWSAGLRSRRPSLRPSRWTKPWHIWTWVATPSSPTLVPRRLKKIRSGGRWGGLR